MLMLPDEVAIPFIAIRAAIRRFIHGPADERWSWQLEITIAVAREFLRRNTIRANELAEKEPEAWLARLQRMRDLSDRTGMGMHCPALIEEFSIDDVPVMRFTPLNVNPQHEMLWVHGGGFHVGSVSSYRGMISHIAQRSGCRILAVDYRLAPEHIFPAAIEDSTKAWHWLLENSSHPEKLFVGGDSAGANIALSLTMQLRDSGITLPKACMLLSPWTDLLLAGPSFRRNSRIDYLGGGLDIADLLASTYAGDVPLTDPRVSPFHGDLSGLPPMLIQVGTNDMLLDDARAFTSKAKACGVEIELQEWDAQVHVWHQLYPVNPVSLDAMDAMGEYMDQQAEPMWVGHAAIRSRGRSAAEAGS